MLETALLRYRKQSSERPIMYTEIDRTSKSGVRRKLLNLWKKLVHYCSRSGLCAWIKS